MLSRPPIVRRSLVAALATALMMVGLMLGAVQRPAAADPITSVMGEACGYSMNVSLFAGDRIYLGCAPQGKNLGEPNEAPFGNADTLSPSVALPPSGSETAVTANDPNGASGIAGPAKIVGGIWPDDVSDPPPTGPISVSTQGTPASGTVTSSATISLNPTPNEVSCWDGYPAPCFAPGGYGPWPASGDSLSVSCSASASGVTGTTTFQNARHAHATDSNGTPLPEAIEDIPDNPPPNYTRHGVVTNVGDIFTVVYNEQIINPDGSLTVNAVHQYMYGPVAIGEAIKGQVKCGVFPNAVAVTDTTPPSCGTPVIRPKGPADPAPMTPRTEFIGVIDAGNGPGDPDGNGPLVGTGIASITNIVENKTDVKVGLGEPGTVPPALAFRPGQVTPLAIQAPRSSEAEQAGDPVTWSFDVTDVAGNTTHCRGVNGTVATTDYYRTPGTPLNVAAPGVLANDGDAEGLALTATVASPPGHGSLAFNADGSFTYTPTNGSSREDAFTYTIDNGAGGVATATVIINAGPATLTINDISVEESNDGDEAPVAATFTVTRTGDASGPATVNYKSSGGTAKAGTFTENAILGEPGTWSANTDYDQAFVGNFLSFRPGETSKTFSVGVHGDTLYEANETFMIVLSAPVGAVLADTTGTATILNDDAPALVSVDSPSTTEGGTATFTISRSGNLTGSSTVKYKTSGGTAGGSASGGTDYTSNPTDGVPVAVTFTPGQTTKTVDVGTLTDGTTEVNETLNLVLSAPVGATLADSSGTATIVDPAKTPAVAAPSTFLSVSDHVVYEGNAGTTAVNFTVTRSGSTAGVTSTVSYKTTGGNATPGTDYTALGTASPLPTLTYASGETSKTVTVNVLGDDKPEVNEVFNLALSVPSKGTTINDGAGSTTILNDDGAAYLSVANVTQPEGDSGTTSLGFTVTRSGTTTNTVTVNYATSGGNASSGGADYTSVTGSLTFLPTETTKTVPVQVTGDEVHEVNETFNLVISTPVGATISDGAGTATILNDEPLPTITVADGTVTELDTGQPTPMAFVLTRTGNLTGKSTMTYKTGPYFPNFPAQGAASTSDYTATSGTVTFDPGQSTKTVNVTVVGDIRVELDEEFGLFVYPPSGAIMAYPPEIGYYAALGTIVDDD